LRKKKMQERNEFVLEAEGGFVLEAEGGISIVATF